MSTRSCMCTSRPDVRGTMSRRSRPATATVSTWWACVIIRCRVRAGSCLVSSCGCCSSLLQHLFLQHQVQGDPGRIQLPCVAAAVQTRCRPGHGRHASSNGCAMQQKCD